MRLDHERRAAVLRAMDIGPVWVRRAMREDSSHGAVEREEARVPDAARSATIATLDWDPLIASVAGCTACGLCASRTQTVFGVGAMRPDCLVIGEAPGADEDAAGEPFVGQSGRLLDAMLASVGWSRTRNVFIANVLKCRPPGNRDPAPDEVASCAPYLRRQIELLAPRMVLLVGKFASATLLETQASVGSLRGREHRVTVAGREVPVVVTYHPAYLLRSLEEKAKAWADLCLARKISRRLG